MYFVEVWL